MKSGLCVDLYEERNTIKMNFKPSMKVTTTSPGPSSVLVDDSWVPAVIDRKVYD
jgi:hypothetical protein